MWMIVRIGARAGLLCAVVLAAVSQRHSLGITVPWGGVAAQPPGIGFALLPGADQGWKMDIVRRDEEQDQLIEQAYSGELFPGSINWTGGYVVFFTGRRAGINVGFRHWFVIIAFISLNIFVLWRDKRRRARTCED